VFSVIGYCASGTRERCRNKLGCALERGKTVMNEGAKSFLVDTLHCIDQIWCGIYFAFSPHDGAIYPHHREREGRGGLKPHRFLVGRFDRRGVEVLCVCTTRWRTHPPKIMDRVWDLLRRNMYTRLRRQILLRNQYDVKSDRNMESYYFLGSRSSILAPAIGETARFSALSRE
jgi:hypothetical protein